jgi:hypothetical protein
MRRTQCELFSLYSFVSSRAVLNHLSMHHPPSFHASYLHSPSSVQSNLTRTRPPSLPTTTHTHTHTHTHTSLAQGTETGRQQQPRAAANFSGQGSPTPTQRPTSSQGSSSRMAFVTWSSVTHHLRTQWRATKSASGIRSWLRPHFLRSRLTDAALRIPPRR